MSGSCHFEGILINQNRIDDERVGRVQIVVCVSPSFSRLRSQTQRRIPFNSRPWTKTLSSETRVGGVILVFSGWERFQTNHITNNQQIFLLTPYFFFFLKIYT